MRISILFNGKHKYKHTPDRIKEKLESLVTQRFSDQFVISDVQLVMAQKGKEDSSQHNYIISFDCELNSSDLESKIHVHRLDAFITEKWNDILDTKKKFTLSGRHIAANISVPAIEVMTTSRVSINRLFIDACANNLRYCRTILKSDVVAINFEYAHNSTGSSYATGKSNMVLTNQGKASFDADNPYHTFAAAILNSADLRKLIARYDIHNFEIEKTDKNELIFLIKTSVNMLTTTPIKNQAPKVSVTPSSIFARQRNTVSDNLNSTVAPTTSPV